MQLTVPSPVGPLLLTERGGAIVSLEFARRRAPARSTSPLLRQASRELAEYFDGRRRAFDLPLAPQGTAFQGRVWRLMRAIPYGGTMSYGEMAKRLKTAARAVGGACGRNPLPILVPCHRVLGAGSALGGYSGAGGLATKRYLLKLEGARTG